MEQKLMRRFFYGAALSYLLLPMVAVGQVAIPSGQDVTVEKIYDQFVLLMKYAFGAALILAVILMAWGGVSYMTAGGDDTKLATAKKRIIWGLIGATIIVAAWAAVTILAKFLGVTPPTPPGTT